MWFVVEELKMLEDALIFLSLVPGTFYESALGVVHLCQTADQILTLVDVWYASYGPTRFALQTLTWCGQLAEGTVYEPTAGAWCLDRAQDLRELLLERLSVTMQPMFLYADTGCDVDAGAELGCCRGSGIGCSGAVPGPSDSCIPGALVGKVSHVRIWYEGGAPFYCWCAYPSC